MAKTNNYHTHWSKREEPDWVKKRRWQREMASVTGKSADQKVEEWKQQLKHCMKPLTPDEYFELMDKEYEENKKAALKKIVDIESLAWK